MCRGFSIMIPLLLAFLLASSSFAFEGLLQAAGEVRKDLPSVPERFALPDWSIYHRTDHLHEKLNNIVSSCPSAKLLSAYAPSLTHSTHDPPATDSPPDALRYITISPSLSAKSFANRLIHKPLRAMFVFGETGRDLITSEIALRIIEELCTKNSSLTLPNVELVLVPLANPNGRRIAEMGRRCERTNANDVDLDRNWPTFWNRPTKIREDDANHKRAVRDAGRVLGVSLGRASAKQSQPHLRPGLAGPNPFSEPETRALNAIVEKLKPMSYVNLRTGAVAMTIPWDCRVEEVGGGERGRLLRVAEGVAAAHCRRCGMGNMWNVTGRTKCGTAADYMYQDGRVGFVHTWHVYHLPEAARGDCFRRNNPVTREGYERVVGNWAMAVINFTTAVHNWVSLEKEVGVGVAEKNATLVAEEAVAKRKDDLAKGLPDPERMEDERDEEGGKEGDGKEAKKGEAGNVIETEGNGKFFSWMFKGSDVEKGKRGVEQKHENTGIGPRKVKGKGNGNREETDEKLALLTGWLGVSTAMFMLAAGMFVVRRYVFKGPPRKSRLLGRRPMKNA